MEQLVEQLSNLLLEKKLRLVTAESCTGGMIASAITDRAGSSHVFERGFVTYSNASKEQVLGVSKHIIDNYGAVSHECADAMVLGALARSEAEVGVAVTGIAGPDGGTPEKPLGLVYIAVCVKGHEPDITENFFKGSREDIRKAATEKALSLLIEAVVVV
ncbi:MAG: nicotinamide-nucleotide amidohydrolase family protein [Alphaproteobacteria bacterium]|nr:nicotinamide-nucleotide amidohydrolase family protein [Alphaproteobacteria bacterium]